MDAKVGLPKAAVIGIPKEPSHFLAEACKLVHPIVMAMSVGGMLAQNILSYYDPSGLHFRRIQCVFASKLVSLCAELREAENVCRQQMAKRTVLFQRLLDDIKYPDSKVAFERKTLRKTSPSQPFSRLLALNSTWNLCRMAASVLETLQLVKKNLGTG